MPHYVILVGNYYNCVSVALEQYQSFEVCESDDRTDSPFSDILPQIGGERMTKT